MWRFAGLAALVGVGLLLGPRPDTAVPAPVLTSFRASGARASGYSVNDWVALTGRRHSQSLARLLQDLVYQVGCRQSIETTRAPGTERVSVICPVAGGNLRFEAESVEGRGQFLVADEVVAGGFSTLGTQTSRVQKLLSRYGRIHESVTLEGTLEGLASRAEEHNLVARMLVAASAHEVNAEAAREWVSLSAYSQGLGQSVMAGPDPVNLEMALVHEPNTCTTLVLLGFPLIAITY